MVWVVIKVLIAGILISFASWLANKKPILAGFMIALPLTSILALSLNYLEFKDRAKVVIFAKSIFAAVPLSLLFFLPFLFAEKLQFPFWGLMLLGLCGLVAGLFFHRMLFGVTGI